MKIGERYTRIGYSSIHHLVVEIQNPKDKNSADCLILESQFVQYKLGTIHHCSGFKNIQYNFWTLLKNQDSINAN